MRSMIRRALVALLMTAFLSVSAWAAEPTYRVIQRKAPAARQTAQPRNGYAYGWFGATRHQHAERHFGYYRRYTQWSRR